MRRLHSELALERARRLAAGLLVQAKACHAIMGRMSKHPKKSREAELQTDLLVYLVDKVEKIVERDDPEWDVATVEAIQSRLDKILSKVRKRAAKLGVSIDGNQPPASHVTGSRSHAEETRGGTPA